MLINLQVLDSENLDKPTCVGRETYDEAIWETCWVMELSLQQVSLSLTYYLSNIQEIFTNAQTEWL